MKKYIIIKLKRKINSEFYFYIGKSWNYFNKQRKSKSNDKNIISKIKIFIFQ